MRLAQKPYHVLQGYGKKREGQAIHHRRHIQSRQAGNVIRYQHATGAARGAKQERPAGTEAVGKLAYLPREQHR